MPPPPSHPTPPPLVVADVVWPSAAVAGAAVSSAVRSAYVLNGADCVQHFASVHLFGHKPRWSGPPCGRTVHICRIDYHALTVDMPPWYHVSWASAQLTWWVYDAWVYLSEVFDADLAIYLANVAGEPLLLSTATFHCRLQLPPSTAILHRHLPLPPSTATFHCPPSTATFHRHLPLPPFHCHLPLALFTGPLCRTVRSADPCYLDGDFLGERAAAIGTICAQVRNQRDDQPPWPDPPACHLFGRAGAERVPPGRPGQSDHGQPVRRAAQHFLSAVHSAALRARSLLAVRSLATHAGHERILPCVATARSHNAQGHKGVAALSDGARVSWHTAAVPVENLCCSCMLTSDARGPPCKQPTSPPSGRLRSPTAAAASTPATGLQSTRTSWTT